MTGDETVRVVTPEWELQSYAGYGAYVGAHLMLITMRPTATVNGQVEVTVGRQVEVPVPSGVASVGLVSCGSCRRW